jgi:hypothetical protein
LILRRLAAAQRHASKLVPAPALSFQQLCAPYEWGRGNDQQL